MGKISDNFHRMLNGHEDDKETHKVIAKMIFESPDSAERQGLLALMYHEGIGVPTDLDKCFECAEIAAAARDGLGLFMLGYMCDNAETPDQAEGGPRQKYDQYDAPFFYEECTKVDSRWKGEAHKWLGDYYMNMARGGDPECAVENYEAVGDSDGETACKLCDYYLDQMQYASDEERAQGLDRKLRKWTEKAADYDPEEYAYLLGCLLAEGIGGRRNIRRACVCWKQAYDEGDWRGADAIAGFLEEQLDADKTRKHQANIDMLKADIVLWRSLAKVKREQEAAEEPDPSIEED